MKKRTLYFTASALVGAAIAAAFFAGRALAGGIPATGALTYSGFLQNASGDPLTGSHPIQVNFWNAATGGTAPLCQTPSTSIALDAGRFSIGLPDTCTSAVKANPNAWVEVLVDGVTLGRTKLGAVPYAVEAGHATSADTATTAATANAAGGALDTRLDAIEAAALNKSAFLALHTTGQSIAPGTGPIVIFNSESFDLGNEYDLSTGVFTPKTAGYYDIGCNVMFGGGYQPTQPSWYFEAGIHVNGVRKDVGAGSGDGYSQMFRARSLMKLAVGDAITCRAYQNSGAAMSLMNQRPGEAVSTFSAVRLSP